MNAKNQRKLCLAGYSIIRRQDEPAPHIKYKSCENPDSWKKFNERYSSKAERDRRVSKILLDDKTIED